MRSIDQIVNYLLNLAHESDVRCQHASAIVERKTGRIMVSATNYHYHKPTRKNWTPIGNYTMHAEEAVFNKFKRNFPHLMRRAKRNYDLVVIRAQRGTNNCLHSKPCKKCTEKINKMIKRKIINRVYYSIPIKTDEKCIIIP
tara:strand:- start:428 stop:853 length:426 start_codon:yes stop_codon:yes gene_type:complete